MINEKKRLDKMINDARKTISEIEKKE